MKQVKLKTPVSYDCLMAVISQSLNEISWICIPTIAYVLDKPLQLSLTLWQDHSSSRFSLFLFPEAHSKVFITRWAFLRGSDFLYSECLAGSGGHRWRVLPQVYTSLSHSWNEGFRWWKLQGPPKVAIWIALLPPWRLHVLSPIPVLGAQAIAMCTC